MGEGTEVEALETVVGVEGIDPGYFVAAQVEGPQLGETAEVLYVVQLGIGYFQLDEVDKDGEVDRMRQAAQLCIGRGILSWI